MIKKDSWKEVKIGDYVDHIEVNERNPDKRKDAKFVSVEHTSILDLRINGVASEEQPSFNRTFKTGQILFAKRWAISTPYPSKIAVAHFDGICSPHLWALETKSGLLQSLLPFILQTNSFFEYANMNSAGSLAGVYLKWEPFSQYKFKLPPPVDQKQMSDLFESIVAAMEQVAVQEKNLKGLRTKLINRLTREQPKFGNVITNECKKVCIEDVAEEMSERVDNPSKSEYDRFVGLEEFQTGEMKIQKWVSTDKLVSAMKVFKNGDVLFARRNVYLKRVSQVDFDGICSGDAIVMRVNKNVIYPEFLTIILNTNEFWDYALTNAAGAFSKRIKWRELAIYTFELPDLKIQAKIMELFNQLETTLSQLKQQKTTLKNLKQKLLNEILG